MSHIKVGPAITMVPYLPTPTLLLTLSRIGLELLPLFRIPNPNPNLNRIPILNLPGVTLIPRHLEPYNDKYVIKPLCQVSLARMSGISVSPYGKHLCY